MAYKSKADQAAAAKRHYENNKALMKERAVEYKSRRRKELAAYVNSVKVAPCTDCNKTYPPYVMEFDHTADDKFWNVSSMVNGSYSLERIKQEIGKCELVCANCHRERTFSRRGMPLNVS